MRAPSTTLPCLVAVLTAMGAGQPPSRSNPDTERARSHFDQGWSHLRSEKYDQAIAEFQQALALEPRLNLAHYGIGRAHMALHHYQDAIREYSTCRDTIVAEAGRKFSNQFEANRARQDRIMELQSLQAQYGKGPQNAQTQDVQRQLQNAIRITQDAADRGVNVSIDASVPAFLSVALGSAYFRANRMDDAEREYKAALAADSKAGEAHNNLAVIYFLSDRIELAEKSVKSAEKAGFHVSQDFKDQIKAAKGRN
jgi:tetratricopeptide (TPR) repeat protein